jgi:hypothetical protein
MARGGGSSGSGSGSGSGSRASSITSAAMPLLLVSDAGHRAVHLVDVVHHRHVGYVVAPGSKIGPRGVAANACGSLVAVSAWGADDSAYGDEVHLFKGGDCAWTPTCVVQVGHNAHPSGLRFSSDGGTLCVAAGTGYWSVALFSVGKDHQVQLLSRRSEDLGCPVDVETVEGFDGGWIVACNGSHRRDLGRFFGDPSPTADALYFCWWVEEEGASRRLQSLMRAVALDGDWLPSKLSALAHVPGVGLVVREAGTCSMRILSGPGATS